MKKISAKLGSPSACLEIIFAVMKVTKDLLAPDAAYSLTSLPSHDAIAHSITSGAATRQYSRVDCAEGSFSSRPITKQPGLLSLERPCGRQIFLFIAHISSWSYHEHGNGDRVNNRG